MPETVDPAVDELRRRARRRLVGAIVLALAAAVVVPMLLESEPKPLGDDVSVRIPPVDDSRFINKLTPPSPGKAGDAKGAPAKPADSGSAKPADVAPPKAEATAPKTDAPAPPPAATEPPRDAGVAATPPSARLADAEQRVLSPRTPAKDASKAEAPPKVDAAPKADTAAKGDAPRAESARPDTPKPEAAKPEAPKADVAKADAAKSAPTTANTADASKAPTPPLNAKAAPKAEPAKPANGSYAVQLAAFIDDKGANALANRLKKSGYNAYTEPYTTSRGTLWRVRVGPYPSREAADAAKGRLKGEGQSGIVTPTR